jgi:hypothetical protein
LELKDRQLFASNLRDHGKERPIRFSLEVVDLGRDDDGDPITTCVIGPADNHPFGIVRAEMDRRELEAVEVLEQVIEANRVEKKTHDDGGAKWGEWLAAYARQQGVTFKNPAELRKQGVETALRRITTSLRAKGWVHKNGRNEYLTIEETDPVG